MKCKPTPLNTISTFSIGISVWYAATTGGMGLGILPLLYFLPLGLFGLLIDFFIQKISLKYMHILIIEIILIGLVALILFFS